MFLPFMTGTGVSMGSMFLNPLSPMNEHIQTVFVQKNNTEVLGSLTLNQAVDQKAKDLKAKALAIDIYFSTRDMPLEGTGMKMVEEAEKNDLDWRLLPAIAVRESTGGKFACKKVTFSAFGWGSCKINFDSHEKGIETVARNLGGNNPKTAKYYADKTLTQKLRAYNPPSVIPRYAEQVIDIMDAIGEEDKIVVVKG